MKRGIKSLGKDKLAWNQELIDKAEKEYNDKLENYYASTLLENIFGDASILKLEEFKTKLLGVKNLLGFLVGSEKDYLMWIFKMDDVREQYDEVFKNELPENFQVIMTEESFHGRDHIESINHVDKYQYQGSEYLDQVLSNVSQYFAEACFLQPDHFEKGYLDVLMDDDDDRDFPDHKKAIKKYKKMFPAQRDNLMIIILKETTTRQQRIIGTASLFIDDAARISEQDEMRVGFIEDVFVDSQFRGKDECVILLDAIKALAWESGCE